VFFIEGRDDRIWIFDQVTHSRGVTTI
jgi:hypothetical protein